MKRITLFLVLLPAIAMANAEVYSPNMNLPVPTVGVTTGPSYATDINLSLGIIDSHDHSPGNGVPITPAGINLSSDLTCQDNNLTNVRSVRFSPQVSPIAGVSDIGAIYESGVDLYFNDGSGNQVRITQSGGVAGSPGSISGLASPASAAFVSANATFVWQSGSSVAGNMDFATAILRYPGSYPTPAGNYVALQAPSSLATGFALTFPATLPGTTGFWMTSDTSGNLSWTGVDNSTLQYVSNVVSIKNSGVGTTQIADGAVTTAKIPDGAVTPAKLSALGQQVSSAVGGIGFSSASSSPVDVTNLTVTITTTGRPVFIGLIGDGTTAASSMGGINSGSGFVQPYFAILRSGTVVSATSPLSSTSGSSIGYSIPVSSFNYIDIPAAGTYTYKVQAAIVTGTGVTVSAATKLIAYEIR